MSGSGDSLGCYGFSDFVEVKNVGVVGKGVVCYGCEIWAQVDIAIAIDEAV